MVRKSMKNLNRFTILLFLIFVVPLCAAQQEVHSHENQTIADSDWPELAASMQKMHVAMASTRPSGDSDADFVRLMLPHHQAAIDMAKTQLMNGKDPQMCRLAQEIITDQQSEIELMQLWLKRRESHPSRTEEGPVTKTN
jgi:uncharacterized protein (DUF305 family)